MYTSFIFKCYICYLQTQVLELEITDIHETLGITRTASAKEPKVDYGQDLLDKIPASVTDEAVLIWVREPA